jgi:hypothetical protein
LRTSNQAKNQALITGISATKDGARLAQSLIWQDIEKIGIFDDFSSPRKAVSGTLQKRDSTTDSTPPA